MSYMHIENLYKNPLILTLRRCFALEKIHGTSAHISLHKDLGQGHLTALGKCHLMLSSGHMSPVTFARLFDRVALLAAFESMGHEKITVYGEAYGGSEQKQAWRYGPDARFVAFDVKIGERWLSVPNAARLVTERLKLEFVHYVEVSTDLEALDAERDAPSVQAVRNGVPGVQPREGVVLRPLVELYTEDGERIIAKHKRKEERETATYREVDAGQLVVLEKAEAIAIEWVTPTRLEHVLQRVMGELSMSRTREVIEAMQEDVWREGNGEIVDSKEARVAIGKRTAKLLKEHLKVGD